MKNILIGKKAIIDNIKNENVLIVHSETFFPIINKLCCENNIPYIQHKKNTFLKNFNFEHQGIVAYCKKELNITKDLNIFLKNIKIKNKNIILLLDRISDVGNFGAIIRTADAFNVSGIIIKNKEQCPINDVVIKNSTGAIYNSNILIVESLSKTIDKLKNQNFLIICSTLESDSIDVNEIDLEVYDNVVIIVGNEKNGASRTLINKSDFKVKISMYGIVQSLNVSVATGIILNSLMRKILW